MKNLKLPMAALASGLLLTACGGGGNGGGNPNLGLFDPDEPVQTVTVSGLAVDGYLNGAIACLDLNLNGQCDAGEPVDTNTGRDGTDGSFSFEATQEQIDNFPVVVQAIAGTTVDTDTGTAVPRAFSLSAPAGSNFVSPITSLVQARVAAGETVAAASSAVMTALGLDSSGLSYDDNYLTSSSSSAATMRLLAQTITQVIATTRDTLANDSLTAGLSESELAETVINAVNEKLATVVTAVTNAAEGTSAEDIAAGVTVTTPEEVAVGNSDGQLIPNEITQDMTLDAGTLWILDGVVRVGSGNVNVTSDADVQAIKDAGVTLTIEPGAEIKATNDGVLLVTRGSQLVAEGTRANPITFSSLDDNYDGLGEWGGVVIQGFAPQYGAGGTGACFGTGTFCNVQGEGGTAVAVYGGNDPADDSGSLRYVRIAEGGLVAGPNNEVNGLTLQGVGYGTELEYIQVHGNLDDGIEWFGGTANLKYAVLTNNDDDSLDYDEGYKGNIQYAIVRMDPHATAPQGSNDPRGIEANSSDDEFVPETEATIANVTIIGAAMNEGEPGMRLRGGLTTAVFNSAVEGFDYGCIRIDDADVDLSGDLDFTGDDVQSQVTLTNVLGDCDGGLYPKREANSATNAIESTVTLDAAFALTDVEAQLASAATITATDNGSTFAFDATDYVGAVAPGTVQTDAWWYGWTIPGSLGEDIAAPGTGGGAVQCADTSNCTISGTITEDLTLSSSINWTLDGVVKVGRGNVVVADAAEVQAIKDAGVTLTIEPGTEIKAKADGVLLVTRGSKLIAEGTRANPITFSSLDDGYDGLGEWGGVVIQGFAPQYGAGGTGACFGSGEVCNVQGEGGTAVAVYGGNDPADDSGSLRYVRIAEGGLVAGPNNEVNGLTLQGVGHGTDLEYIQVHGNLDDGIEWFGGTVNLKYAVLTNNDDDSLDYDEGYQGNIQYAIIRMDQDAAAPQGSNDPRGIEANSSDDEYAPETNATIANVLVLGGPLNNNATAGQQPGMRLRGALTTAVYNSAVRDFDTGCIRIDDADVDLSGDLDFSGVDAQSQVTLTNIMADCADGIYDKRVANTETNVFANSVTVDTAFAIAEVEARLDAAPMIAAVDNGSNFAFDNTDFIGAVAPGTSRLEAWWSGWTIEGSLGEDDLASFFPDFVDCSADGCTETATISGTISQDFTMISDLTWILDGVVRVGTGNVAVTSDADVQAIKDAGVTLTIQAGTDVRAKSDGVLLVTRGSKIEAIGTAAQPITFSSLDDNYDGLGEWGGVVIQGFAPQYGAGGTGACFGSGTICNVQGEGGTAVAVYGGNDPADDSGTLRYVRIAEGGLVAGPNNEVNGLTLQGVGHSTDLEYIQVHGNLDDGIEWFGGTVDLKYAVLTNNDDDSLDFDEGYKGNIQYALILMDQTVGGSPQGSNDPRGVEANSSDDEYVPETQATLANITIVGGDINSGEPGMRLRGGLTTSIYNSAIEGFEYGCVRVDDADVDLSGDLDFTGDDVESQVSLENVLGDCLSGFYPKRDANSAVNSGANVVTFNDAWAVNEMQAILSSAPGIAKTDNGGTFQFDDTAYVGAVAPGTSAADAWWADWTIPGSLEKLSTPVDDTPDFVSCTMGTCAISGEVDQDYLMVNSVDWILDGVVTVGAGNVTVADAAAVQAIKDAGVTLTIQEGTNIEATNDGILLVTRGSKLIARGEKDEPITFSSRDSGFDGLGEWGGVVIQGFAPQYGAGGTGACFGAGDVCNVQGEGGTAVAVYGGNDPADNSGQLRYVRIAEGGLVAGPNNEVNGLTLQGVGHATDLQYIQVHGNLDDGIEWFGGTVNLKYAVLTNNDDDSLDYDEGYQGNIQHVIIGMDQNASAPQGSNDPRGIEANSSDDEYAPQTNAAIANVLIIGGQINDGEPGMRLRGGLTTSVYNTAVRGFDYGCVRIDDADVDLSGDLDFTGDDVESQVSLTNVMADCDGGIYPKRAANSETNVFANSVTLDAAFAIAEVEAQLAGAPVIMAVDNGSGFSFDSTDYIGAVAPGTAASDAWWADWTIPDSLQAGSDNFPDFVDCSADGCTQTATVSGTITQDYTLTADLKWILDGVVRVGAGNVTVNSAADVQAIKDAGVTLSIAPGTDVRAEADGILLVTRGSKINAVGTAAQPITFSSADDNYDGLGEWGGIVIQGFAPQYGAGGTGACYGAGTTCNVQGEGGTAVAVYGGDDPADDSGTLRYVRIAEGGLVAGPNNEVNGLTLQGVGHSTDLEYIQVHGNLDDGIEWFGGTVNLKYAVLTNNDDDSLDYDEGYQGNIQYALILMDQTVGANPQGSNDPRGIEANSSDDEFVPETNATIANVTIIGGDINAGEPGMRLRGGLTTAVYNSAIEGFDYGCVRVDDADVDLSGDLDFTGDDVQSQVTLVNVLGDCLSGFYPKRDANSATNSGAEVVTLDDAYAMNEIQAVLDSAPTIVAVNNGSGFVFDNTSYVGAIEPGTNAADAWWAGWTIPGSLDKLTNPADESPDFVSCLAGTCTLTGTIDQDYRLVRGTDYVLDGVVTVGAGNVNVADAAAAQAVKDAGVTLTIEEGVTVLAENDGVLLVTRGSKIMARGEADEPITFASTDAGFDGLGEWGGVVIQGFAPQYGAGGTGACFGAGDVCNVQGEGGTAVAVYGGNDPADNSGMLRYVRIAEGGLVAGPNNEVNGLTLQGVGHGTDLQYIQVHGNLDDGIEWFGGTVNLKYAVLTNNDDDSLDYDEGYQGNIQYALIRMDQTVAASPQGSNDPRGIEANSSDDEFAPETNASIANVTIIGGDINAGEPGMRLRGGLTTSVYNSAVEGFDYGCVRIDDADVDLSGDLDFTGDDVQSQVTLVNVLGDCAGGLYPKRAANSETNATAMDLSLDSAYALTNAEAALAGPVAITEVNNGSDFSFDDTDYIGAVEPGTAATDTWFSKWVIPGSL